MWINLKDAELVPDMENSINQLQELFQKKYVDEKPSYEFEEQSIGGWVCNCTCGGVTGHGRGTSKIKAKKRAAYMVLIMLLESAGICEKEWRDR
jgi:ribonuclease-3